jgi:nitroreductase
MFDEPMSEAWRARYGQEPPPGLPDVGKFLNHRSVRKFKNEPVSEDIVKALVACAQSAATSSNLQLWSVVSVQDPERREEIARLCADQNQIRDAAWYFAFFADHHRLRRAATEVGEAAEGLEFTEFFVMAVIDAALAAERMVCAAEAMGLGICYIGALRNDAAAIKELLSLPEGVFGVFGLCLGWPEEPLKAEIKPRLSQDAIWFRERYQPEASTTEYDERMRNFYERQRMKGDVTWRMRSGRRVDLHHMTGRDRLKPWLLENRFLRF